MIVNDRTLTLTVGAQTSFAGQVTSVVSTGGAIVVDEVSTIPVTAGTSLPLSFQSRNGGGSEGSSTSTTDSSNGGVRNTLSVLLNAVVALAVCGVIAWL